MKSLYESTKSFISCLLNIFVTFPLKIVTNEFKETSPIKSGVHSSPLLLFRKPEFFHAFSIISDNTKSTENVWKTLNFLKSDNGLLCAPHLVYSFF